MTSPCLGVWARGLGISLDFSFPLTSHTAHQELSFTVDPAFSSSFPLSLMPWFHPVLSICFCFLIYSSYVIWLIIYDIFLICIILVIATGFLFLLWNVSKMLYIPLPRSHPCFSSQWNKKQNSDCSAFESSQCLTPIMSPSSFLISLLFSVLQRHCSPNCSTGHASLRFRVWACKPSVCCALHPDTWTAYALCFSSDINLPLNLLVLTLFGESLERFSIPYSLYTVLPVHSFTYISRNGKA